MIKMNICILFAIIFSCGGMSCGNFFKDDEKNTAKDTIVAPLDMSRNATLLNLGSDQEPILIWGDYIGILYKNGKKYPHIHGIRYCSTYDHSNDTTYYESMEIRQGKRNFDFRNAKISDQVFQTHLLMINGQDSIVLFPVLELEGYGGNFKGIPYRKVSTIKIEDKNIDYYTEDISLNISRNSQNSYLVTYKGTGLTSIPYKLHGTCDGEKALISFINREDGKIYFLDKDCYLEPINREDVKNLKKSF